MSQTEYFADLILPVPIDQLFTYKVPQHLIDQCSKGKRAVVQFGKKKIYSAIIRNIHHNRPVDLLVKEIIDIIDDHQVVSDTQFAFWEWMAGYYMCTIGEVYQAALPAGLRLESSTLISYNADFFEDELQSNVDFSTKENTILDVLKQGKPMSLDEINNLLSVKNCMPTVKSLYEKGTIRIEEELGKGFKPKTEKYITLSNEYSDNDRLNEAFDKLKRAPKQYDLLSFFLQIVNFEGNFPVKPVLFKTLVEKSQIPSNIVSELVKKRIFEVQFKVISRFLSNQDKLVEKNPLQEFQKEAYNEMIDQFRNKDTLLLHGITSSGKTEIYIHLIEQYLQQGKQVLYLLPEIALTTQIIERLKRVFGQKAGIYHSRYSDAERVETYRNILGNEIMDNSAPYQLILGVRSAVFLPFKNLGLVIIDEEHESTFKQYNPAPRYQARDSAIMLAKLSGAKTLLGSATPSIETYFNTKTGKYGLVNLNQRYQDISLPEIIIADVKEARRKKQMKSHFTPVLLYQMGIALQQGEQVILFQNRRGYALYIECHICGWIPKCRYCDVSLTYHRQTNQLVCHYCGYARSVYDKCDNCNSTDIRTRGFGTEKVEEELSIFFPDAKIKRLDLDSAKGKHAYSNLISDFENRRIDILVGTQMVTKGLDFDNVSLVGVLDANQMLNFPDFRAYERSYQLMAQVGGRAGRKNKQGKVIIQTISPENPVIQQVAGNDYQSMFNSQANERKHFAYPPFNRLINITLKHKDKVILDKAAFEFANTLRNQTDTQVIGPEYPIIGRIYEYYLKNILVKLNKSSSIPSNKKTIMETGRQLLLKEEFRNVQVVYDVDPY